MTLIGFRTPSNANLAAQLAQLPQSQPATSASAPATLPPATRTPSIAPLPTPKKTAVPTGKFSTATGEDKMRSGVSSGKLIGAVFAVFALAAIAGGAVWFIWFRKPVVVTPITAAPVVAKPAVIQTEPVEAKPPVVTTEKPIDKVVPPSKEPVSVPTPPKKRRKQRISAKSKKPSERLKIRYNEKSNTVEVWLPPSASKGGPQPKIELKQSDGSAPPKAEPEKVAPPNPELKRP